jgi:hypothetical protein
VHFGLEDDAAGGFIDRERTRVSSIGKTKLQSWWSGYHSIVVELRASHRDLNPIGVKSERDRHRMDSWTFT